MLSQIGLPAAIVGITLLSTNVGGYGDKTLWVVLTFVLNCLSITY